ncbi:MAG: formylglycine-generating enzyme family protein [Rubripirellula sp.]
MHGNAWEWCSDRYAPYPSGVVAVTDPTGADRGSWRVGRGSSWFYGAKSCRSANRGRGIPSGKLGTGTNCCVPNSNGFVPVPNSFPIRFFPNSFRHKPQRLICSQLVPRQFVPVPNSIAFSCPRFRFPGVIACPRFRSIRVS